MTRFIIGGVTGCAFVDDQVEIGAFGLVVADGQALRFFFGGGLNRAQVTSILVADQFALRGVV
jgi:hypothetical protein